MPSKRPVFLLASSLLLASILAGCAEEAATLSASPVLSLQNVGSITNGVKTFKIAQVSAGIAVDALDVTLDGVPLEPMPVPTLQRDCGSPAPRAWLLCPAGDDPLQKSIRALATGQTLQLRARQGQVLEIKHASTQAILYSAPIDAPKASLPAVSIALSKSGPLDNTAFPGDSLGVVIVAAASPDLSYEQIMLLADGAVLTFTSRACVPERAPMWSACDGSVRRADDSIKVGDTWTIRLPQATQDVPVQILTAGDQRVLATVTLQAPPPPPTSPSARTPTPEPSPSPPSLPPPTSSPTSPTSPTPTSGPTARTLKVGFMAPLTNDLGSLGPSMVKAMSLAMEEVNKESATTGFAISLVGTEDDTTGDQVRAVEAYRRLVGKGAVAIIGPCCSGVTSAILSSAVDDEVIVASPSATSPALTQTDRHGFFWRVSPTDTGQGRALARLLVADGIMTTNMIIVDNDYGNTFAAVFGDELRAKGGSVGTISKLSEVANDVSAQVTEACAGSPASITLVAYTRQGADALKAMEAQGCRARVKVYASEGIFSPVLSDSVVQQAGKDSNGKWIAEGLRGTTPQAASPAFSTKYVARYGEAPQMYAAESWDAVMYVAIAALKAGSSEARVIKTQLVPIANEPGTSCREFRECAEAIARGEDVDFRGYAHDLSYTSLHEPKVGAYSYWSVRPDGIMGIFAENIVPS